LFDVSKTREQDPFAHTFFSEIDVVTVQSPDPNVPIVADFEPRRETVELAGGYTITVDTSETPELTDWAKQKLIPMASEWYPKIVAMLPSEGFEAPKKVSITLRKDMNGVAATSGTRINCAARWFKANLEGEAVGAVFHELVHVVQQYGGGRRNRGGVRPPGWLTEGIADYLRWFQYEPESHGAEITRRNLARARYDGNYRISANFLNWVCQEHDPDAVRKLNAAIRTGSYTHDLWTKFGGGTVEELGAAWRAEMEKRVTAASE